MLSRIAMVSVTAAATVLPFGAGSAVAEQASAPELVAGTPCTASAHACVSLSRNRAWLIRAGEVYYGEASALGGRPESPTPAGVFHVTWKDEDHHSEEFDAPMPNSVFFTNTGVAFHQGSLTERSAGCIHLSKKSSAVFFDKLQVGDEVQVVP
ncbi:murein L,D-transpeptidase [Saccharopolyspora aridisoli]|uniref:Murein L,D-transpeptidase n=1 Tax=Saccharopolyspora aridisoli TaxID=2530385 RepID=A0A4R4UIW9_9PSEU|nr:L,D-transpeptidase [Saccharopolyspora aridisoli]TDC91877.1 murein L,D-transpeptidase [Saccharopolyspora aridisoli]